MLQTERHRVENGGQVRVVEDRLSGQHPQLGRAVEREVCRLLGGEDMETVHVRFRDYRSAGEGAFVCQVEYPGVASLYAEKAPWTWWSSVLRGPEELREELAEALLHRRRRMGLPVGRHADRARHVPALTRRVGRAARAAASPEAAR